MPILTAHRTDGPGALDFQAKRMRGQAERFDREAALLKAHADALRQSASDLEDYAGNLRAVTRTEQVVAGVEADNLPLVTSPADDDAPPPGEPA